MIVKKFYIAKAIYNIIDSGSEKMSKELNTYDEEYISQFSREKEATDNSNQSVDLGILAPIEKHWLSTCIGDPIGEPMECCMCESKYKHRGDFLMAILCSDCRDSEIKRVNTNYEWFKDKLKDKKIPMPELIPFPEQKTDSQKSI